MFQKFRSDCFGFCYEITQRQRSSSQTRADPLPLRDPIREQETATQPADAPNICKVNMYKAPAIHRRSADDPRAIDPRQ